MKSVLDLIYGTVIKNAECIVTSGVTKVKKGKHFPICRSFKSGRHSNTKVKQDVDSVRGGGTHCVL